VPPESVLDPNQHQSLPYSSDLELGETIQRIFEAIERLKPKRVVIDSLSEIRLLAQSSLRYRRQILALKHYFAQHSSTVIMLDDLTTESTDRAVHSEILSRTLENRIARSEPWHCASVPAGALGFPPPGFQDKAAEETAKSIAAGCDDPESLPLVKLG
jgi:KaiC